MRQKLPDAGKVDWSDLGMVKRYADAVAKIQHAGMTVILRPRHRMFNVINTKDEDRILKDATVVYRTKSD